jgi:hypothetical protein
MNIMRLFQTKMRLAIVALSACFSYPNAQAAPTMGDGWQALAAGSTDPIGAGTLVQAPTVAATQVDTAITLAPTAPADVSAANESETASPAFVPRSGVSAAAALDGTAPRFELVAGEPLEAQLMAWAARANWHVLWNLPQDNNWIVPGDKSYGSDFEAAVQHVIESLAENGADIVGDSWRENHTIVITQSGATEQ